MIGTRHFTAEYRSNLVNSTEKYRQIQKNTDKYRKIQTNTEKYRQIQKNTDKYRKIQTNTEKWTVFDTPMPNEQNDGTDVLQHLRTRLNNDTLGLIAENVRSRQQEFWRIFHRAQRWSQWLPVTEREQHHTTTHSSEPCRSPVPAGQMRMKSTQSVHEHARTEHSTQQQQRQDFEDAPYIVPGGHRGSWCSIAVVFSQFAGPHRAWWLSRRNSAYPAWGWTGTVHWPATQWWRRFECCWTLAKLCCNVCDGCYICKSSYSIRFNKNKTCVSAGTRFAFSQIFFWRAEVFYQFSLDNVKNALMSI